MILIGVAGKKLSGKDTFAKALFPQGFLHFRMADTLKNMIRLLLSDLKIPPGEIERYVEGSEKEEPIPGLGVSFRHLAQTLGTEWRDMVHEDLWTIIMEKKLEPAPPWWRVIITDIRFPHEVSMVRRLGGKIVRINRPGLESSDSHKSETLISSLPVDIEVENSGTIEELREKALGILAGL